MPQKTVCGFIDRLDASGVLGWAGDLEAPYTPLTMQLVIDGTAIDILTCGLSRMDVQHAGFPSPLVGFFVRLPEWSLDGVDHTLEFHSVDGETLNRSEFTLADGTLVVTQKGAWRATFRLTAPPPTSAVTLASGKRKFLQELFQREAGGHIEGNGETPASAAAPVKQTAVIPTGEAAAPSRDVSSADMQRLLDTGTFQPQWYLSTYSDISDAGVDPLTHYYFYGFKDNRRPNPYFDSTWYLAQNPDLTPNQNPLVHYLLVGEAEGRRPIFYFDPVHYREAYDIPAGQSCLGHYLANRLTAKFSPVSEFDATYYAEQYPDVAAAGVDSFEHYVTHGFREGRNPSRDFDTRFYRQRYLRDSDESPLLHYLQHKDEPGIYPSLPDHESTVPRQVKLFTKPGPHFEERMPLPRSAPRRAKILAYYLPQFHAFPENDEWWGRGFTEWTNLGRGLPRFIGHYQPRVPRDLGHYSLNDKEVLRRQIEMARDAGLFGFVFYFYWFNSSRLMERPLDMFIADQTLDFPFCLMWANENWSRRWDGSESEVLISQDYRDEDNAALVDTFVAAFRDPRYIRIDGRPLLMLYRPGIIPDCNKMVGEWRRLFRERGGENPIIVMSQSFNDNDPDKFGLDGAIEFPPHKLTSSMRTVNDSLKYLDSDFTAQVYSYDDVVERSVGETPPPFPQIKTLCPSWDNDARRQGSGLVIHGSTPAKYQAWLEKLIEHSTKYPFFGEPFVCINAWNEWAEGTYLEPDLYCGSAYLNATARAVTGAVSTASSSKLLLVGHDAFPSGAQQLLLNIGKMLRRRFGLEINFLLLAGGKMEGAYAEIAPTKVYPVDKDLKQYLKELHARGFRAAIVNTSAAAAASEALADSGIDSTLLVHELPRLIAEKGLLKSARTGLTVARQVVFPATFVRDKFLDICAVESDRTVILPQGSYKNLVFSAEARSSMRAELGIPDGEYLAIGIGYADLRKGFDLFLQIWRAARRSNIRTHFCWVGDIDPAMKGYLSGEIQYAEETGTFRMLGFRNDIGALLSAADVFVLPSREDPYPSVALEAISVGTPVLAFSGTGGIPDTLHKYDAGIVVALGDVDAAADALIALYRRPNRDVDRQRLAKVAAESFSFAHYVDRLCDLALPWRARVSVVVPNYNYAHHIRSRLATIFGQTYPVHEVIVLDDCSKDNSLEVIEQVAVEWNRDVRVIVNDKNSGSVFRQWRKAAEVATGDFVWIAEADDESDPSFLERLVKAAQAENDTVLAFTDSRAVDGDGKLLWPNHQGYFASAGAQALANDGTYTGREFVRRFLSERNLILNVSCAIWNRAALARAMQRCVDDLLTYRMAGDWYLYVDVMTAQDCHIAYVAEPLNVHRRHAASVTHTLAAAAHVAEIERVHQAVRDRLGSDAPIDKQDRYVADVAKQLEATPLAEAATASPKRPSAGGKPKKARSRAKT